MRKRALFMLYNTSGYFNACASALGKLMDVLVIHYPTLTIPVNDSSYNNVSWVDKTAYSLPELIKLVEDYNPTVCICGGWAISDYLEIVKRAKNNTCCVLCMDTPWKAKAKQRVHCLFSRIYLVPHFDFVWCAGEPQALYAERLGFQINKIVTGLYCANTELFNRIYQDRIDVVRNNYPHRFLYVGRYVAAKNMLRMQRAFLAATERSPSADWKLICVGKGNLWNDRIIHPSIEHRGYCMPEELPKVVNDAGVFVLPSLHEPWGVVVHEFAVMGLPLICSREVVATTAYLKAGFNGFMFNSKSEEDMEYVFQQIMKMTDMELFKMGENSHILGMSYTLESWVKRVETFRR